MTDYTKWDKYVAELSEEDENLDSHSSGLQSQQSTLNTTASSDLGSKSAYEDDSDVAIIEFLDFEKFKNLSEFPRCPDHRKWATSPTIPLESISRDESLLIFISHCWIRGRDAKPHPDNAEGDKFKLCVKGIQWMKQFMAPRMKYCYVWMDFSCIDQDNRKNLPRALKRYDKIVECCDAIFTPVVDFGHADWKPSPTGSLFSRYEAKLWKDGPDAYLNRAWCRVEMMYAAHIPVLDNTPASGIKRHALFEAGLANHCRMNRRPHVVYGHKEFIPNDSPRVMPPLQNSYFEEYHPLQGSLSVPGDVKHIQKLLDTLQWYIDANTVQEGYQGEKNAEDKPHGVGMMKFVSGNVYEGEWCNGAKHGRGTFHYANGGVYEGEWKNDLKDGQGTYYYADGESYTGEWKNGKLHGRGTYRYDDGESYEGEWWDDCKQGFGVFRYLNGAVYEGEWKNDRREGDGEYRSLDGSGYKGQWSNNEKEGRGVLFQSNGAVAYEGDWKKGTREGHGVYHYPDGAVYEGEWRNDKQHGRGVYEYGDGEVYEGEWCEDKRHGAGTFRFLNGEMYQGEWKNDVREGKGVYRYADGTVYLGEWRNNVKEGQGRLLREDASVVYEGEWKNDTFVK